MTEPKYPEDFKDWKPLYPLHNNRYLVLESPDGVIEACIHLEDNEVVGIKNKTTGEDIYDGNLRRHYEYSDIYALSHLRYSYRLA